MTEDVQGADSVKQDRCVQKTTTEAGMTDAPTACDFPSLFCFHFTPNPLMTDDISSDTG